MRLGSKTDDEFLIKLNKKNSQIQSIFHEKIKEIAKKHLVDVMMQDGIVKKQETFDVEKIHQVYNGFANRLQDWTLDGISSTNDEGIRRNFIKLNTNADNCRISLHLSIQYHVILFYQPNYEVMKKQKELSDFMDETKKHEGELTKKSDHLILEKLRAEGYKKQVVAKAEGEASRFLAIYNEYVQAKQVTQERMYLETMEKVLADIDKVIIDKNASAGVVPYLPLPELKKKAAQ